MRHCFDLEQTREGILIRRPPQAESKLDWGSAYRQMATEAAERSEWDEWDSVTSDGIDD